MAALRCLHNRVSSTEADATRLSIISRRSGKGSLPRTAARRCPRMRAADWSELRKMAIYFFLNKPKESAIYQVCSVHLHGMQHFPFRLQTHRSDSALIAPTKAKRSTLTDLGSFAGPAPKLMTCLCSMFKCQMFPRCDCSLLLSPSASAGFLLSCTRRRR